MQKLSNYSCLSKSVNRNFYCLQEGERRSSDANDIELTTIGGNSGAHRETFECRGAERLSLLITRFGNRKFIRDRSALVDKEEPGSSRIIEIDCGRFMGFAFGLLSEVEMT